MSQENVEIVRSIFELALRKRDLDAALPLFAEDALVDWSDSRAPYSGVYRGVAEIRRAFEGWQEAWDEWETKIVGSTEVDAETVVVATDVSARGRGSGIPVRASGAGVWVIRDGRVTYAKLFQTPEEALAAVGLSDEAG